jgi:glutathione synthase/RimK-type ligase-like ATP-grasp enzyme
VGSKLVVVATPGDKRTRALAAAVERVGCASPRWIPWREAIAAPARVGAAGQRGDFLRVDSPGADTATWRDLAGQGGSAAVLPEGQWRPGAAWFRGLTRVLAAIDAGAEHLRPTHPSRHILAMTDKWRCQERLEQAGVATPPACLAPDTAAALRDLLATRRWPAVFVKPRFGSSGAGVLAWRRSGVREQLVTPAALHGDLLVNDKHLHSYENRASIDRIFAIVLSDAALVQRWIPKAGSARGPFDLRVLVIDGVVALRVGRVGRGPITNLHLDAERAAPEALLAGLPRGTLASVDALCLAAAAVFPGHRCLGVDLLVDPRGRPFVVECNAWGDFLPGLLAHGQDSYELQLRGLMREMS